MKIVTTQLDRSLDSFAKGQQNNTSLKKQAGFSLIEIIVAALILSTSILGVAGLQIIGMKGTQQSTMKTQAMGVVQNLTERMRANHKGVIAGRYSLNDSALLKCATKAPNCTVNCDAKKIAKKDLHNVVCGYGNTPKTAGVKVTKADDIGILINGTLKVACLAGDCSKGDVVITVGWSETAYGDEKVAADSDSLTLTTRIAAP